MLEKRLALGMVRGNDRVVSKEKTDIHWETLRSFCGVVTQPPPLQFQENPNVFV